MRANNFCIQESFNTNISHQLFDYTITFLNSQRKNTNSNGDFCSKPRLKRSKINPTQIWYDKLN